MEIKGIDISKHQKAGKVNFKALRALGYEFVMLRAGYGKYLSQKDATFESHYAAAKAAGLHVGAYHYSYATTVAEAKQEAACFLEWIKDKRLDYPVAFDIEDKGQKNLTNVQRTDIAIAFMQTVEAAGYYTMLYSSADWLGSKFDWNRKYCGSGAKTLSHFDVWCAAYVGSRDRIQKYYNGNYGMWQYTSSKIVPSVYLGRLDYDIAYKDYAAIIRRAGLNNL